MKDSQNIFLTPDMSKKSAYLGITLRFRSLWGNGIMTTRWTTEIAYPLVVKGVNVAATRPCTSKLEQSYKQIYELNFYKMILSVFTFVGLTTLAFELGVLLVATATFLDCCGDLSPAQGNLIT